MNKNLLFVISITLFAASLITLVVSMVYHAVLGDGTLIVPIIAGASAAVAVAGLIFACLAGKSADKDKGE